MALINLKNKRLLHFFQDEKVVNEAIENFETAFQNENLFVVITKNGKATLVNEHPNTLFLTMGSSELDEIIKSCRDFSEVVLHSMCYEFALILPKMNHPNVCWVIWGADLYEDLLYKKGYKLYIDEKSLFRVRAQKLPVFLYKMLIGYRDSRYYKAQLKANRYIHSVCALSPDYELLVKYFPEFKSCPNKYLYYYPIEKMLDDNTRDCYVSGKDIWVNNAAAYNGNHIDILQRISKFRNNGTVHVPLSYGMTKWAKYVESEGRRFLGEKFDPMLTFMPRGEYYKRFLGSNSFVFGHLRQCAVGNILVALYLGAKVFLFKDNPLYSYFKEMGIQLYSIDEDFTEDNVYASLSDTMRQQNREIILNNYSYQNLISLIKQFF